MHLAWQAALLKKLLPLAPQPPATEEEEEEEEETQMSCRRAAASNKHRPPTGCNQQAPCSCDRILRTQTAQQRNTRRNAGFVNCPRTVDEALAHALLAAPVPAGQVGAAAALLQRLAARRRQAVARLCHRLLDVRWHEGAAQQAQEEGCMMTSAAVEPRRQRAAAAGQRRACAWHGAACMRAAHPRHTAPHPALPYLQALLQARCVRKLLPPGLQPPQLKRMQEREPPSNAQRGTAPRHGPASIGSQHLCAFMPPWSRPSVAHLRGGREEGRPVGRGASWRRHQGPAPAGEARERREVPLGDDPARAAPALCSLSMRRQDEQQGRDERVGGGAERSHSCFAAPALASSPLRRRAGYWQRACQRWAPSGSARARAGRAGSVCLVKPADSCCSLCSL